MSGFNLQFHTDTQNRKWLIMAVGSGALNIPDDVYGIAPTAFMMARGMTEVHIPLSVEEIAADTFGGFDNRLTIFCRAEKRPEGWVSDDTSLNTEEAGFEKLHNYWLGSGKFTFSSEGVLEYHTLQYRETPPNVVWGAFSEQ